MEIEEPINTYSYQFDQQKSGLSTTSSQFDTCSVVQCIQIPADSNEKAKIVKSNKIQKRSNQKLKQVQFILTQIPSMKILINEEFFYIPGDIAIDFQKKNCSLDDRYSAWNICKKWKQTKINKNARIFSIDLQNSIHPPRNHVNDLVQRYKYYPNQYIHNFMNGIEEFMQFTESMDYFLSLYFNQIKSSPELIEQHYQRKALFSQYNEEFYKKLNEQGVIFFSTYQGPILETNEFSFYEYIFSESLSEILGKSLEELQDMYRRNGGYDFFDFESQIEIFKLMIQEKINQFNLMQKGQDLNKEKMITYDDIVFYTRASFQTYKLSDFTNEESNPVDFYTAIIYLEITPEIIQQIISIRAQNEQKCSESKNEQQQCIGQSLEYTLQAEIFKEKFIDDEKEYIDEEELRNKTCKYRQI